MTKVFENLDYDPHKDPKGSLLDFHQGTEMKEERKEDKKKGMHTCTCIFWLLLGVEDTLDVKQWRTKGQKNEENNKNNSFVRWRSIVTCAVSSTPSRSPFS